MPNLTLKYNDNIIHEYRLKKGGSLTIGRRDTNDVVIENLAVSGSHAKIDSVGDGFLITDLKSKNGSFVNEQLFNSHYLNHGDKITIGKHTLVFTYATDEPQPDALGSGMDQTMVMDTDQHREMLAKTGSDLPPGAHTQAPTGILTYLTGGTGDIELTKKLTKIGKDAASDIVISGLMAGKTAATISIRPKGHYLSYVGGIAKPKVNGETIKTSVKLNEFDEIEVGSAKLQFLHKS
jgi:hypothetical protein